jgi:hypothetical protein
MALALKADHFRNGSDSALHRKAQGIFLRFKTTCVAPAARLLGQKEGISFGGVRRMNAAA